MGGNNGASDRSEFWRKLIEGRQQSGFSVAQVCKEADVSPASFYHWQRKLGIHQLTQSPAANRGAEPQLVPVQIVSDMVLGQREPASVLELELPGEIRLRIPAGFDRATLQVVINLLRKGDSAEAGSC